MRKINLLVNGSNITEYGAQLTQGEQESVLPATPKAISSLAMFEDVLA